MTEYVQPQIETMPIRSLHISAYVELASKMRRYWRRMAILIKATDNGKGVVAMYRNCLKV